MGADRPARLSLIHPGTVCAGSAVVYRAQADEAAEARRGVLSCAETLAMDQCRKWLTKWRLKSADWSIMRDSHVGISGFKGPVLPVQRSHLLCDTLLNDDNDTQTNRFYCKRPWLNTDMKTEFLTSFPKFSVYKCKIRI